MRKKGDDKKAFIIKNVLSTIGVLMFIMFCIEMIYQMFEIKMFIFVTGNILLAFLYAIIGVFCLFFNRK